MRLNQDEHELLRRIAAAEKPVAMSEFFHDIHPPNFPTSAPEADPDRVVWQEHQFNMYGASVKLWQEGLVQVIHPANGEQPDLVEPTEAGRSALA
ncbi:hypothetical protein AB0L28_34250 [Streptomyces sp. NPDC052503]|uniref:hypothetical protein n=1 Tax=Streptomyces sp. NPDC052503 TaxID=3156683 RepID=UPI0014509721|nr:hypothetical protein [Streptomyces sp. SID7834]MYT56034.1 hypothetical protein [Streptomyces sp. SID7834]MYT60726.1 hypothetical protein [Streptomyces sp. SID7834]